MKKYICQGGCGNEKSAKEGDKTPECCGKPMKDIKDGEKKSKESGGCCCCC